MVTSVSGTPIAAKITGLEPGWIPLTKENSRYKSIISSLPFLHIEVPLDEENFSFTKKLIDEGPVSINRLKFIGRIYLVEPSAVQAYYAKQLRNVGHGQMSRDLLPSMEFAVNLVNKKRAGTSLPKLELFIVSGDEFQDDFLHVRNNIPRNALSTIDNHSILQELSKRDKEEMRNHCRIDLGTCGHNNSDRNITTNGLAKPKYFKATMTEWAKQYIPSMAVILSELFPVEFSRSYCDKDRQREFAAQYDPVNAKLEALAAAMQLVYLMGAPVTSNNLKMHCDRQNDGQNSSYEPVYSVSEYLYNESIDAVIRLCHIVYGKNSAGNYMEQVRKFQPILDDVYKHFQRMQDVEKYVSMELYQPDSIGKELCSPHTMKTVLYSVFCHVINELDKKFNLTPWHVVALLYLTCVSNIPNIYYFELMHLLTNPKYIGGQSIDSMDPFDFATAAYHHLFDVKEKARKKCFDYPLIPRHQPCHNKRANGNHIRNSMYVLARAIYEINTVKSAELRRSVRFHAERTFEYLVQSCPGDKVVNMWEAAPKCGIFGGGYLIVQHVLGVASCLQIIPSFLLSRFAVIGKTTATWRFFQKRYGTLKDEEHLQQSSWLIAAISHKLKVPAIMAEEIMCRTKQHLHGTSGRFRDYIPTGCPLIHFQASKPDVMVTLSPDGSICSTKKLRFSCNGLLGGELRSIKQDGYWAYTFDGKTLSPKKSGGGKKKIHRAEYFSIMPRDGLSAVEARISGEMCVAIPDRLSLLLSIQTKNRLGRLYFDAIIRRIHSTVGRHLAGDRQIFERSIFSVKKDSTFNLTTSATQPATPRMKQKPAKRPKLTLTDRMIREPLVKRTSFPAGTYYSHGYRMPEALIVSGEIYYPPHHFPLLEDPKRSIVYDNRRYFVNNEESKKFTSLYMIFSFPELFSDDNLARLLLDGTPGGEEALPAEKRDRRSHKWGLDFIQSIQVLTRPFDRKSYIPELSTVTYLRGGRAIFRLDDTGNLIGGVLLQLPYEQAKRQINGVEVLCPYYGISRYRGRGKSMCFEVAWIGGGRDWVGRDDFVGLLWPIYNFAKKHNLIDLPEFRSYRTWGDTVPDLYIGGNINTETVKHHRAFLQKYWVEINKIVARGNT